MGALTEKAGSPRLERSRDRYLAGLEYKPNDPVMLGNQGHILFRRAAQRSIADAAEAIRLGGGIRNAVLKDADIDPTPL